MPTTLAGHRFWEHSDPTERFGQLSNFLKNAGLLGGLLLAAVDTEGKPSVGYRARRAARRAADATEKNFAKAQKRAAKAQKKAKKQAARSRAKKVSQLSGPLPPAAALRRIAFLLERAREPSYRVQAFRTAAAVVDGLDDAAARPARSRTNTLKDLKGVGPKTAAVVVAGAQGAGARLPGRRSRRTSPSWSRWPTTSPSSGPRCAATCTCTPTGPTAAARSARWPRPRSRSATSTWR